MTRVSTLTEGSDFFKVVFSGQWKLHEQPDGSYFFDYDGDTFEHILCYLRTQSLATPVFPLFFDQTNGHDYIKYQRVLTMAQFLQIPRLEQWITEEEYSQALQIDVFANVHEGTRWISGKHDSSVKVEYYPFTENVRVFVCPRGVCSHRGRPNRCDLQCRRARVPGRDPFENVQIVSALEVRTKVVFPEGALSA